MFMDILTNRIQCLFFAMRKGNVLLTTWCRGAGIYQDRVVADGPSCGSSTDVDVVQATRNLNRKGDRVDPEANNKCTDRIIVALLLLRNDRLIRHIPTMNGGLK